MGRTIRALASLSVILLAQGASHATARTSAAPPGPSVTYRVGSDSELRVLTVRACFRGAAPSRLTPGIGRAGAALLDAHDGSGRRLPTRDGAILLRSVIDDGCVRYRVDLDAAVRAARVSQRSDGEVITSLGAWLWRPPTVPRGGARLELDLPDGVYATTPFPRDGDALRLDASAFTLPAFMAFGRREPIVIERQSARVEVLPLGAGWQQDDAEIERWMSTAIDGIATVQGRFPVDRLLVVLVPSEGRGMGFGMVRRGGGCSLAFTVGRQSTPEDLLRSWVTWHELSHLQLPALPQRDAWLYEGLATYYQEVIPARMGVKTDRAAWGSLLDGFERGSNSQAREPLAVAATTMFQTGGFVRVYWSGTVFALQADVRLRERGRSLDALIREGAARWRADPRVWSSEELCDLLDLQAPGSSVRQLRDHYAGQVGFPPTAPLLGRLGVASERGEVELRDAPLAAIRSAIFRAPSAVSR